MELADVWESFDKYVFALLHQGAKRGLRVLKLIIAREGKYFVAVDLITNVADQGLTENEAIANLKKGLEEHYQILMELTPKGQKLSFLDIEVEKYAPTSCSIS